MSWTELQPPGPSMGDARNWPVVMAAAKCHGRTKAPRLWITVRPSKLLHGPMTWWQSGEPVSVHVGAAEHAKTLRISRGGAFAITMLGASKNSSHTLILPLLPGMVPQDAKLTGVEFEYADGWLEIELPQWALAATPIRAVTAAAAQSHSPFRIGQQRF